MNERNVLNGAVAVFLSETMDFLLPLKWLGLLALMLIFADLRFGVLASKKRGEEVRFSRAIRRTMNKIVDYICWLLLAGAIAKALGNSFDIHLLDEVILMVIFGVEINSCFSNYFEANGKKFKVDIFKFLSKKTDIIEIEDNEKN